MRGHRVQLTSEGNLVLANGDYCKGKDGVWYHIPPNCHYVGSLAKHEIKEHADGTISVRPSILHREPPHPDWHGFLVRGEYRDSPATDAEWNTP